MTEPTPDLTVMLRALADGENAAADELMPHVSDELRAIARAYLAGQSASHTLQPSALVNEAFLKLFAGDAEAAWADRVHFFAVAARAMRHILVDHARRKRRPKHGGGADPVTLHDPVGPGGGQVDVLDVHAALEELAALDERQGRLVELRYFGGLEVAEVAEVLGTSKTTVEREWRVARAWLGRRLTPR